MEVSLLDPQSDVEHRASTALLFPRLRSFYSIGQKTCYALLRLAFGMTIVSHGIPKLTGSPHGSMADPMQGSINLIENVLHLPFAPTLAIFIALLETVGGLCVTLGFATRLFAPMLAIQMAFICVALGPTYPWIDRGIEYPIILGFIALLIAMRGGDAWSIDATLGREL
jgi:putative oxidoreductase